MQTTFGSILVGIVLALAVFDLRRLVLPNGLDLLLAGGGGQSLTFGKPDLLDAGLGAWAGALLLTTAALPRSRVHSVSDLGDGDRKFVAAAGLWIGRQGLPPMLLVAWTTALSLVAARAAKQRTLDIAQPLPFGPFLDVGTLAAWLEMHAM